MCRVLTFVVIVCILGCDSNKARKGNIFFNNGEYAQALQAYNAYLEAKPNDLDVYYRRARTHEKLDNQQEAFQDYNFILIKDKLHAKAHAGIAGYYYKLSNYEKAIYHYDHSLAEKKDNPINYLLRGKCHQKLGNLKEAMLDYNNAIGINDAASEFYVVRGSLRLAMKQRTLACNDFKVAKRLGNTDVELIIKKYCQ